MKNALIAILLVVVGYLVLHALGLFDYELPRREEHVQYARRRAAAVNRAKEFKIRVSLHAEAPYDRFMLQGIRQAAEAVNARGGIWQGRPLRLEVSDTGGSFEESKFQVQEACEDMETALLIGMTVTAELPTLTTYTYFQALPSIAPSSFAPDFLYRVPHNTLVPANPPMHLWLNPIVADLEERGCATVLILSPGVKNYGGRFATEAEQKLSNLGHFSEVYRLNYAAPARENDLAPSLRLLVENRTIDAILFTGEYHDLEVLDGIMRELGLSLPIYGSIYLDWQHRPEFVANMNAPLIVPYADINPARQEFLEQWTTQNGEPPSVWTYYGAAAIHLLQEALLTMERYDPYQLTAALARLYEEQRRTGDFDLVVHLERIEPITPAEIKPGQSRIPVFGRSHITETGLSRLPLPGQSNLHETGLGLQPSALAAGETLP